MRSPGKFALCALGALCFAAPSVAADPVTLRFTVWDGDVSLKIIRGVLKDFERENPGVLVMLENIPDYATYHQKMLTLYAADVAPDVAMMDPGHFQALAKRGALLPLNPFFGKTPGFNIKDYYDPIVKAHSWKGNVYVLPRDIAPEGIVYYNKKAFDEAGIPYPDGSWTWDFHERPELKQKDFIWVCDKLTKRDATGKPVRWAFSSGWPQELADTFMYSTGGHYADNDEHPTKITTTDPRVIRAYQYAADFMNKMRYMPNSTETSGVLQQTTQQLFASQKIAMYQNGIWDVPKMRETIVPGTSSFFDWDITLFPAFADGTRGAPTGGSGYSVFSSTKYPDLAWKLTCYMAGPKSMAAMAKAGIAQPAIRSVALTKDVWLPGSHTPLVQQYPQNRLATDQAVPFVHFGPTADYWPEASDRVSAGLDILWTGQTTAAIALPKGAAQAQDRLDYLLKKQDLPAFDWRVGIAAGFAIVAAILICVYWPERKVRYTGRQKGESRTAYKFITPWLIGMAVFTLGPMVFSLLMSTADWDIITPAKWRGIANFVDAGTTDPVFWKSMLVTSIYTGVSVPLGLFVSLMLALMLNQKVKGQAIYRSLYFVPSLASGVAAALVWRRIFNPDQGLLNTIIYGPSGHSWLGNWLSNVAGKPLAHVDWLGTEKFALPALIIMSAWGAGGTMIILLAGLQGIPQHYYEAATLDGAGIMGRFKNVTLPLLTPTLFFCLVTGVIGSFQVFTQAVVITSGGPNDSTNFYMYNLYKLAFQTLRMGMASALAWILFLLIMIATLAQFRFSKWVYYEADAK